MDVPDGFTNDNELEWLREIAAGCQTVVEIGCWKGRSTKALAYGCPGTVYAVDDFRDLADESATNDVAFDAVPDLEAQFRYHLADEIESGKVVPMVMTSAEAATHFSQVDLVFIDGTHTYPAPLEDIRLWQPRARKLCGHDVENPGVSRSLDEAGVKFMVPHGTTLWVAA